MVNNKWTKAALVGIFLFWITVALLLTGCTAPTPTPPPLTRQEQVVKELGEHGYTIKEGMYDEYEGAAIRTCANDNPYFLPSLADLSKGKGSAVAIRIGIKYYCPERLAEWDELTHNQTI